VWRATAGHTINMACADRFAISVPFLPNVIICDCEESAHVLESAMTADHLRRSPKCCESAGAPECTAFPSNTANSILPYSASISPSRTKDAHLFRHPSRFFCLGHRRLDLFMMQERCNEIPVTELNLVKSEKETHAAYLKSAERWDDVRPNFRSLIPCFMVDVEVD
jgi:hypothetical protein